MKRLETSGDCVAEYEGMYTSSTLGCELHAAMTEIAVIPCVFERMGYLFTFMPVTVVCSFWIIHVTVLSAESAEIGQMRIAQLQVSARFS